MKVTEEKIRFCIRKKVELKLRRSIEERWLWNSEPKYFQGILNINQELYNDLQENGIL